MFKLSKDHVEFPDVRFLVLCIIYIAFSVLSYTNYLEQMFVRTLFRTNDGKRRVRKYCKRQATQVWQIYSLLLLTTMQT